MASPKCARASRRGLRPAAAALCALVLLLASLSTPAESGSSYDPTTLVYPTFKHDLGIHHVNDFHLRLFTGNRHRFREPKGIVAVKLRERDAPDKTNDDDELTVFGVNSAEHCIIYNTSETSLASYGSRGSGEGEFLHPWGIAADPEGNVYVADAGNDRVVHLRYHRGDLRPMRVLTGARGDTLSFRSPRGVAISSGGDLYVADTGNDRVVVMNRPGEWIRTIGGAGILERPEAIAVMDREERWSHRPEDFLVLIDKRGGRVRKMTLAGEPLDSCSAAELGPAEVYLRGIAIDYYHNIYLTDEQNNQIHKLDDRLRWITSFGREGGGDKEFHSPFGITVWRRFGQCFISERTGAQYYWVGADVLDYHGEPAVFEGTGVIVFRLTERARVDVRILDPKGKEVRTLVEGRVFLHGDVRLRWDGKDDRGDPLPPGRYKVRIGARATYSSSKHFQKEVEFLVTLG